MAVRESKYEERKYKAAKAKINHEERRNMAEKQAKKRTYHENWKWKMSIILFG